MKPRPEWAKLTAKTSTKEPPVRLLDLPGFRALEDKVLLFSSSNGDLPPEIDQMVNDLSRKTFGITEAETEFQMPEAYWDKDNLSLDRERINRDYDRHERQFEMVERPAEDAVTALRHLGFDFTDDHGLPLGCTKLFSRQAVAVAKGIMATCRTARRLAWTAGLA